MTYYACVARPVSRKERNETPAALEACAKEWHRLRNIKHKRGVGVWDESKVREKAQVRRESQQTGVAVHFARIFDLCVEKGSELPEGHPERKFKGRAVLQGDQVKDQNWETALFQDLSSSPAAMEALQGWTCLEPLRSSSAAMASSGRDSQPAACDQRFSHW